MGGGGEENDDIIQEGMEGIKAMVTWGEGIFSLDYKAIVADLDSFQTQGVKMLLKVHLLKIHLDSFSFRLEKDQ